MNRFFFLPQNLQNQQNHPVLTIKSPLLGEVKFLVFSMIKLRKTTLRITRQMTRRGVMQTRVLLVEDRVIHRGYFETLLRHSGRYELVGTENSMADALQFCDHTAVDLILTDAMDRKGGACFAALAECRQKHSHVRTVVVTDSADPLFLEKAEENGADSFWYAQGRQSLLSVLDRTMEGKSVFPAHLPVVKIGQAESCDFSEKEVQILREVVKGDSNKEIALTLQMSYYTVRDYVKSLLEKTALSSRTALAAAAVASGLIVMEKSTSKPVI